MKQILMTPGPTPVPENIMREMAQPIIHHRTPEYKAIFKEVTEGLRYVLRTKNDVFIFTSSGTGAMEASVSNILSPGDKAVVVMGGKFGERFAEICKAYGVQVTPFNVEWGTAPDPEKIKQVLDEDASIKAVFTTLCETSTATVYDIKAIGEAVSSYKAVLVVDVISGLGADDFRQDDWQVDIAVGGSQKALMVPPGLSFCSVSPKAMALTGGSSLPKYYFDFKVYKKAMDKDDTPFTPGITLMIGLKKALDEIKSRGIDKVIEGCAEMSRVLEEAARPMGLKLYSKSPSKALSAFYAPDGKDGAALAKDLKARGITVAGGQGELKGKIIRIAHMGGITRDYLDAAINALKEILS